MSCQLYPSFFNKSIVNFYLNNKLMDKISSIIDMYQYKKWPFELEQCEQELPQLMN